MLSKNNAVLQIDAEYTRPAIESLLGMFEEKVKRSQRDTNKNISFEWWVNLTELKKVQTTHVDRGRNPNEPSPVKLEPGKFFNYAELMALTEAQRGAKAGRAA